MKGIREWRTQDDIAVVEVHYSADPDKDPATERGRAWYDQAIKGYQGGAQGSPWRKEMEIDWAARGGELVFPIMRTCAAQIRIPPFTPPDNWRIYGGFDWGNRNPSAFIFVAVNEDGWLYIIDEIYGSYLGHKRICRAIKEHKLWPRIEHSFADPSLWNEDQSDRETGAVRSRHSLFIEEGVVFLRGDKGDLATIELVNNHYWPRGEQGTLSDGPFLFITENCTQTWREWSNLRYAEHKGLSQETHNQKEQLVDKDNHTFDAVKSVIRSRPRLPKKKTAPADPALERIKRHVAMKLKRSRKVRDPHLGVMH